MNDIRYVKAILEKKRIEDNGKDAFNDWREEKDPYDLLLELAEELEVDVPESIITEEVEEGLKDRRTEYVQHYRDALDEMVYRSLGEGEEA